jgi:hypothetical protein
MSIQRRNHGRGHSYLIDGVKADGVTTLISEGLPKPALIGWAAGVVAEYIADSQRSTIDDLYRMGRDGMITALKGLPASRRGEAAVKGTKVHGFAERLGRGEEVAVPEELYGHVRSAISFLDDWDVKPILVERVVASRQYGYCGTLDMVADVMGKRAIVDYKTGASGIWPDAALQLSAYRHADCYLADGVEIPMSEVGIEIGYGVHLRSDGYDLYEVQCDKPVFGCFLAVRHTARNYTRNGRTWISEPQFRTAAVAA